MKNDDFNLDQDLAQVMAPVEMPVALRERLARIPQQHPQRPRRFFSGLMANWLRPRLVSSQPRLAIGMSTGFAAAAASLVLGIFLGAGDLLPAQTEVAQQAQPSQFQMASAADENDAVAMVYGAADLPGELP